MQATVQQPQRAPDGAPVDYAVTAPGRPRCTAWCSSTPLRSSPRPKPPQEPTCKAGRHQGRQRVGRICKRPDHPDPSLFRRPGTRGRGDRLRQSFEGPSTCSGIVGANPGLKVLTHVLDWGHRHSAPDCRPQRPHSAPRQTILATQSPPQRHEKVRLNDLSSTIGIRPRTPERVFDRCRKDHHHKTAFTPAVAMQPATALLMEQIMNKADRSLLAAR